MITKNDPLKWVWLETRIASPEASSLAKHCSQACSPQDSHGRMSRMRTSLSVSHAKAKQQGEKGQRCPWKKGEHYERLVSRRRDHPAPPVPQR